MDEQLQLLINQWFMWDKNAEDRAEIKKLQDSGSFEELQKLLSSRLEFGTAGLRARMGAGYSRMCDLVILQTAQGLLRYLEAQQPNLKSMGVVIGYDARHRSTRFAEITANIFVNASVPVRFFNGICPTPYVAYAVRLYGAACGVMVTASHNPKEDNGYKVYWSNGSQILSPHDKGIAQSIEENLEPWTNSWPTDEGPRTSALCTDPMEHVSKSYNQQISKLPFFQSDIASDAVKFVYTPMHGVGQKFVEKAFEAYGLKPFTSVPLQMKPDPEFPTVKFPNPEEGKSALNLSIAAAEDCSATVILANDPDADRLALAEKLPDGKWKVFTGNEMGALIGYWLFYKYQAQNPAIKDFKDVHMLASTVSSKVLRSMAEKHGFNFEETLTGFKWMGDMTDKLMKQNKTVLFAFEEAIGFMCGTEVLDKDGVSAAVQLAECALHFKNKHSRTLTQQLDLIWQTYGHHVSDNSYYICHDPVLTKQIFNRIRTMNNNSYPNKIGKFDLKSVRDLTTGFDNSKPGNKATLPSSSSSQMVTFTLECGAVLTLRTSGTEPKIKYYSEYIALGLSREQVESELKELVESAVEELLQPTVNKLIARSA